jgi:hypothetical protein
VGGSNSQRLGGEQFMQPLTLCEEFVPTFFARKGLRSPRSTVACSPAHRDDDMEQGADARYLHSVTANETNHVDQSPLERQDDQVDARFDWIPSEMDSLLARFLLGNSNQRFRPVCRTSDKISSIVGVGCCDQALKSVS